MLGLFAAIALGLAAIVNLWCRFLSVAQRTQNRVYEWRWALHATKSLLLVLGTKYEFTLIGIIAAPLAPSV